MDCIGSLELGSMAYMSEGIKYDSQLNRENCHRIEYGLTRPNPVVSDCGPTSRR